jgi:hypothetical protein
MSLIEEAVCLFLQAGAEKAIESEKIQENPYLFAMALNVADRKNRPLSAEALEEIVFAEIESNKNKNEIKKYKLPYPTTAFSVMTFDMDPSAPNLQR